MLLFRQFVKGSEIGWRLFFVVYFKHADWLELICCFMLQARLLVGVKLLHIRSTPIGWS